MGSFTSSESNMKAFSRGFCRLCGDQVDSASRDVLSVPCHEACADTLLLLLPEDPGGYGRIAELRRKLSAVEDVAALESHLSRQVRRLEKRVGALEGAEASEGADTDEVEALAEVVYTAQVESIFQEWPHSERPYVPWSGLQESVKRIHRAAVRAVLERL